MNVIQMDGEPVVHCEVCHMFIPLMEELYGIHECEKVPPTTFRPPNRRAQIMASRRWG